MSPEQVFVATARRGQEASPKGNGEGVSSRTSGVNQPRREGQGGLLQLQSAAKDTRPCQQHSTTAAPTRLGRGHVI